MVWTILHEWLSGEKTLPEATRDWLANRTRSEVALMLIALLVQSYLGALIARVASVTFRVVLAYMRTTPSWTVVEAVSSVVLFLQLLYLMLTVRRISTAIDGLPIELRADSRNVITEEDNAPNDEPTTTPEGPDDPV